MFKLIEDNEDFTVALEWNEGVPFLHVEVFAWSPSILKRMRVRLQEIKKEVSEQGSPIIGAYSDHQDDKWFKFMELFHFDTHYMFNGLRVYLTSTKVT